MRIRRHAKISQLVADTASSLKPASVLLQTYDCRLNQSPWDVMTFSPPSSPLAPLSFQVNGADASGENGGSNRRSSVGEREIQSNGDTNEMAVGDAVDAAEKKNAKKEQCCKTDGKSWRCRREAADGNSLCHHHMSLVKNYQNLAHNLTVKKPAAKSSPAEPTRHSTRSSNKASLPPDSHEFYYYSGFRPGWSKKRGQTSKIDNLGPPGRLDQKREARLGTWSQIGNDAHEMDSEEDDDYEEGEEGRGVRGNGKKKRVRKPIKARSLKSLM